MAKIRNFIYVILVLIFAQMSGFGQRIEPFFKIYSREFLEMNEPGVMSVYEDPKGYLWFCTLSGLKRWDGVRFLEIPVDIDNPKALPDPRVSSMVMDHFGKYWIINRSGFMLYDPTKPVDSCITRLDTLHKKYKGMPDLSNIGKPTQLRIDKYGMIWVALHEMNGILKINPKLRSFEFLEITTANSVEKLTFYDVQIDDEGGVVWALSRNGGVCTIDLQTHKIVYLENDLKKALMEIWQEKEDILSRTQFWRSNRGFVWCMTANKPFAHYYVDERKALIYKTKELEVYPNNPGYDWERCLEDDRGNFWITNFQRGMIFVEFDNHHAQEILANISDLGSLAHNLTNKITKDSKGNIWIGHRKAGVSCFSYDFKGPRTMYPLKLAKEQVPDNYHLDVFYDSIGNEYLDTYTGHYLKKYGSATYEIIPEIPYIYLPAGDGNLWSNYGETIQLHLAEKDKKKSFSTDFLRVLTLHSAGRFQSKGKDSGFWFYVNGEGIYHFHVLTKTLKLFTSLEEMKTQKIEKMIRFYCDFRGDVWLHLDNGFAKLNLNNKWETWIENDESNFTLLKAPIEDMTLDNQGNVWLNSRNNIIYYDGKEMLDMNFLKPYNTLRINSIYSIQDDIWIGNQMGAIQYNKKTKEKKIYPVENGVFRIKRDPFGKIALLNLETISYIYPVEEKGKTNNLKACISEIKIFEKNRSELLEQKSFFLEPDENFITFYFGNKDFLNLTNTTFAYQLLEVDKDWVFPSDGRKSASYSNLSPGNYTFKVRLFDEDDQKKYAEDIVHFTLRAHWYQQWWFTSLLVFSGIGLIFLFLKMRIEKRLIKQKMELEKKFAVENERSRIARDMHDDLGSGLSAINLLSNFLKNEEFDSLSKKQIEKIAHSSQDLNQKLREIIWSMNSGEEYIQNLIDFTRRYLSDIQEYSQDIKLECKVTPPLPEKKVQNWIQKEIFLCIKESINNALKHSQADKIVTEISCHGNYLNIEITDNGIGCKEEDSKKAGSNGLQNMRFRVEKMKGEMQIINQHGCRIVFLIPLY